MNGASETAGSGRSVEQQLREFEFQLAHHQRAHEQLNEVVVEHTKTIMRLEMLVARLEAQVKDGRGQTAEPRDLLEEKPPHY